MVLLRGVGCKQTKLLGKTIEDNSGSEKSGLIRKEDPKKRKKETELEWEVEDPEQKAKREIGEKTRLKWKAEGEKKLEQQDSISPRVSKITF